jgi:hypothetical protein
LQGGTTAGSPVLAVNAPYVLIENLGFKPGSSTTGLIHQKFYNDTVTQAWADSYYRVWFRNVDAQAGYSLRIDSGSYDQVIGCTFSGHPVGISLWSINDNVYRLVVKDCDFESAPASATAHIASTGAVTRVLFHNLNMIGLIPAAGSPAQYIYIAATSTGMASKIWTGAASDTLTDNFTLNGINPAELYAGDNDLMV